MGGKRKVRALAQLMATWKLKLDKTIIAAFFITKAPT
jgi:hypothetical protein